MNDSNASMKLQPELLSGESILWAGMPSTSVLFHPEDGYMIPFSLLWGGFAIFWEASVLGIWGNTTKHGTGAPAFMVLWGIPFVLVGQYFIWGRFLYDAWLKRRTYYGVTNRRVLIVQEGWQRKTSATDLAGIPTITREGSRIGTLWFGPKYSMFAPRGRGSQSFSRFILGPVPVFSDIDEVDAVYRLILEQQEKARAQSPTSASPYVIR